MIDASGTFDSASPTWAELDDRLTALLRVEGAAVAVSFVTGEVPAGIPRFLGEAPSGCSFWRIAAERPAGRSAFATVPDDHHNCPIGSYTHNIPLPPERAPELEQTLGLMASIGYIKMEEVGGIPRLPRTPGVVVYAPLGETPVDPDVVLFAGRPGRVMLLQEAALRAGVAAGVVPLLARPTCMALPAALSAGAVASTACIGNRVYTDVGDDELYVVIPGKDLPRVVDQVSTITGANTQLSQYHRERRRTLATE
jgi:uncharacterized protein (DUF169 family)